MKTLLLIFPFSSNEGIYQGGFTFCSQAVLRRRAKHIFYTQVVLRRRVKQRLTTTVTFKGIIERQNSSRERAEETEEHNQCIDAVLSI